MCLYYHMPVFSRHGAMHLQKEYKFTMPIHQILVPYIHRCILGFQWKKNVRSWLLFSGFFVNIMFILSRVITTVNDIQDMKCQVSIPLSPLSNLYFKKLKPSSLFNIQWPHNILNKSKSHWVSCQRISLFVVVFTTVGYFLALCTTEHNSSGDLLCCCSVLGISLSLFHSLRVCLGTHPGCFPLKTKQQTREFVRRPLFQKHSMDVGACNSSV